MTFETLKKSHLKRNILIAVVVVAIISAVVLNFTRAKYRTTESIPLIQGTINFSPSDFNMIAVYLNKGSETVSADKVPHVGYTLNEEESTCESPDGVEDSIGIEYIQPSLTFSNVIKKGTKCSVYFDLIPDSEKPVINSVSSASDDTSVTVIVDATDNVGIFYYYFQLDNEEEIRVEENAYTFAELKKGDSHTINIRVEDAAGNEAISSKNVTVGLTAKDVILAQEGGVAAIEGKGIPDFSQTATTDEGMYAAEDNWGTSYYYRGAVQDNWVQFGTNSNSEELYWRIIRINGDGTVRLIYNGTTTNQTGENTNIQRGAFNDKSGNNMYVGYMYGSNSSNYNTTHENINSSSIKGILDTWYQNNLADEAEYIDGNAGFCGDRVPSTSFSSGNGYGGTGTTTTYYGAFIRLENSIKSPILTCTNNNDLYTMKGSKQGNQALTYSIGLITADEVVIAGGVDDNSSYYLYNNIDYWTISPNRYYSGGAGIYYVTRVGQLGFNPVYVAPVGIRPVINLKSDITITGSGSTTDPYTIS